MCSCPAGMAGNAFISCEKIEGMINKKKLFFQKNLRIKKNHIISEFRTSTGKSL